MPENASAQSRPPGEVKDIVMVHGAWADGSAWARVIPPLERMGFQVTAVHLPLTSLADDAAAVQRALKPIQGPVLLVGHSYGGVVITVAGMAPNVVGLVYVAAFAPDAGQSAADLSKRFLTPMATETIADDAGFIKITRKGIEENFAQDLSPTDRSVIYATHSATSVQCLASPATSAAWREKRSWYVLASNDRTIAPELQKEMAASIGARTTELPTSHVPMLSRPNDVVNVVAAAARDRGAK